MNRIGAKVTVSGDMHARLDCDCSHQASVSVGTIAIRDGTNNYERLANKPRIEGMELVGNVTLPELKVAVATEHDIDKAFFG